MKNKTEALKSVAVLIMIVSIVMLGLGSYLIVDKFLKPGNSNNKDTSTDNNNLEDEEGESDGNPIAGYNEKLNRPQLKEALFRSIFQFDEDKKEIERPYNVNIFDDYGMYLFSTTYMTGDDFLKTEDGIIEKYEKTHEKFADYKDVYFEKEYYNTIIAKMFAERISLDKLDQKYYNETSIISRVNTAEVAMSNDYRFRIKELNYDSVTEVYTAILDLIYDENEILKDSSVTNYDEDMVIAKYEYQFKKGDSYKDIIVSLIPIE